MVLSSFQTMTSPDSPSRITIGNVTRKKEMMEQQGHNKENRCIGKGAKHRNDIRDGKFFHIRVSLGYLTSLRNLNVNDNCNDSDKENDAITVFASFSLDEVKRGEYNFATSLPIEPNIERQTVKWPKGNDFATAKRRLYHSVILRLDDLAAAQTTNENKKGFTSDDESVSPLGSPAPYIPAFVKIYIGLKRGDEVVSIGVTTLVISGRPIRNQKMDLPVKNLPFLDITNKIEEEEEEEEPFPIEKKRTSSFRALFSRGKNQKTQKAQTFRPKKRKTDLSSLALLKDGSKRYAFEKTAMLQIKLDTIESVHQNNGPGLWGDMADDEDSYGNVSVIKMSEQKSNKSFNNQYEHETIEVMQIQQGATIIASPGHGGEAENFFLGKTIVQSKENTESFKKGRSLNEKRSMNDDISGTYSSEYESYVSTGTRKGSRDYSEGPEREEEEIQGVLSRFGNSFGLVMEDLLDIGSETDSHYHSIGTSTKGGSTSKLDDIATVGSSYQGTEGENSQYEGSVVSRDLKCTCP